MGRPKPPASAPAALPLFFRILKPIVGFFAELARYFRALFGIAASPRGAASAMSTVIK
jgi:hypothetical protein